MKSEYRKGALVKLAAAWSEGDTQTFVVVGEDEGKGRVDISSLAPSWRLKVKNKRGGWVSWWWVYEPSYGSFVKTTWTVKRPTAARVQSYDRENGWEVGKLHRTFAEIEKPKPGPL